jgi:ribosomal protein S18 acetylase RimI-like enzyme
MRIVKNGGLPDEEDWLSGLSSYFGRSLARGRLLAWLCLDGGEAVASAALRIDPVRKDRTPLGTARAGPAPADGYIMSVYTKPGYRRRGISRALLGLAIEEGRKRGLRRLVLHPTDDGRPLYESLGFRSYRTVMILPLEQ